MCGRVRVSVIDAVSQTSCTTISATSPGAENLAPLDNPFGTRLSPMSRARPATDVSGLDTASLAEGEELGSNPLRVSQRSSPHTSVSVGEEFPSGRTASLLGRNRPDFQARSDV